jgi:hypothetical protein
VLERFDERILYQFFRQTDIAQPGSQRSAYTGGLCPVSLLQVVGVLYTRQSPSIVTVRAGQACASARTAYAAVAGGGLWLW